MDYAPLGRSGLMVSRLCLGCMTFGDPAKGTHPWTLPEDASRAVIRRAVELGINFFDTANAYSDGDSEAILGRALRDFGRRDEQVIATKAYAPWGDSPNTRGLSRKALFHAIDDSLKRLGTDYVDLFQIHRFDDATPVEETLEALHDIVKAGKARYIGASSMFAWQFAKMLYVADRHGWSRFISMQNHLNLLYREEEREMLPLCRDQGVGVIPWSPLARGRLTRDWDEETERTRTDAFGKGLYGAAEAADRRVVEAVAKIARSRGAPRAQVALAWVAQRSGVTAPIVGASRLEHLEDAVAALGLALTAEDIAELDALYAPHAVVGLAPGAPGSMLGPRL